MTNYARLYRFGFTPWERYATAAAASIAARLDREETGRPHPLGRALDLGCGRGLYTLKLARIPGRAARVIRPCNLRGAARSDHQSGCSASLRGLR